MNTAQATRGDLIAVTMALICAILVVNFFIGWSLENQANAQHRKVIAVCGGVA